MIPWHKMSAEPDPDNAGVGKKELPSVFIYYHRNLPP